MSKTVLMRSVLSNELPGLMWGIAGFRGRKINRDWHGRCSFKPEI